MNRARGWVLALATALIVAMTVMRLFIGDGDKPGAVVYAPAVALFALELGAGAGVVAGLVAGVLFYVTQPDVEAWDVVLRGVSLVALGALVGAIGSQLREARGSARTAAEINDNVIQALVLAKYAAARGDTAEVSERIDETLDEARAIVDGLVGSRVVRPGQLRRDGPARVR